MRTVSIFLSLSLVVILSVSGAIDSPGLVVQAGAVSALLERSMAAYGALSSYADTGTIAKEAPGFVDRFKFKTRYRKQSLDFYFECQGVASENPQTPGLKIDLSARRIVLWMMKGELEAFNQELQSHESYPREGGNQAGALQNAGALSSGTSILIPSLLYAKSNLPGTIRQIEQASEVGFENVGNRKCHKVMGIAAEYYPSGQKTNVRPVTVWVDAENLLIRKVFEDTPKGYPLGSYSRLTVTIEPQANPKLDDSQFQFTVPSFQQ